MTPLSLDYATPSKRTGQRNGPLICLGLVTALFAVLFFSANTLFIVPLFVGFYCAGVGCFRMGTAAKKRATAFGLVLCVATMVGPFLLFAWANREGKPIKIVIPAGYRGEFSIVKDHSKGQGLTTQDGMWVFEIPPSGILTVKKTYPFHMWHTDTYVYSDGTAAHVQDLGTEAGNISTPNGAKGSTEYDGTTFRWKILDTP